jgi:hypothetical protein
VDDLYQNQLKSLGVTHRNNSNKLKQWFFYLRPTSTSSGDNKDNKPKVYLDDWDGLADALRRCGWEEELDENGKNYLFLLDRVVKKFQSSAWCLSYSFFG